ncbi:MAG: tetratricopeptide repeat protein [Alphaproteobacteria bacterium]|nr:tetratricopeptide repeat protein [Alphaproteobacteria bacterium]MBL7099888.1 tetratricopeptide repeat protein [Alphaproteobacteria bacterium]
MSDIFHEVEEEVRRERFEKLWKQYGDYIIAGVALIIIAIAGYELWTRYQESQRIKTSESLILAQELADSGNFVKSTETFNTLAKDAPGGYAEIARLSRAGVLLAQRKNDDALTIYKQIAADDQGPLGGLATIRAAWILAETASPAEVQSFVAPLLKPVEITTYSWWVIPHTRTEPNAWRFAAQEVLAYADYHAGLTQKAQAAFAVLGDDKDAPEGARRRAQAMATFLKNGGLANFGTVPPPAPETPPATPTPGAPAMPAPTNGTPPK